MSNPTEGYRLHHSMIRVKDPQKSRNFYERLLGMTLCGKKVQSPNLLLIYFFNYFMQDFEAGKFTLYFFSYLTAEEKAEADKNPWDWIWSHRGTFIELTQYVLKYSMKRKKENKRINYYVATGEQRTMLISSTTMATKNLVDSVPLLFFSSPHYYI